MKRNSVELVRAAANETEKLELEVAVPYVPSTKVPRSRSLAVRNSPTERRTSHHPPFSKVESQNCAVMMRNLRDVITAFVVIV